MMTFHYVSGLDILCTHLPVSLTVISCLWLFFKYCKQTQKGTGFTMITILTVSDFIFSLTSLGATIFPLVSLRYVYQTLFYTTTYFSVLWASASAMAFIVFKSLKEREFDSQAVVFKGASMILCIALLFAIAWDSLHFGNTAEKNQKMKLYGFAVIMTPLILGLIGIFGFSLKSIKLLKAQSDFVQKSTAIYIRNLRVFSLAQIFAYGPLIFNFVSLAGFSNEADSNYILIGYICSGIANLAGFINVMIFLLQGSINYSMTPFDQMDLDLTQNESSLA